MDFVDDVSGNAIDTWNAWCELTRSCWTAEPEPRPSMPSLYKALRQLFDTCSQGLPEMREIGTLVSTA